MDSQYQMTLTHQCHPSTIKYSSVGVGLERHPMCLLRKDAKEKRELKSD